MIQALHAILGDGPSDQKSTTDEVTLLYGSRNKNDILGGDMLRRWASMYNEKFKHIDVLSHEPADSDYHGERGFIDKAKIEKFQDEVQEKTRQWRETNPNPNPETGDDYEEDDTKGNLMTMTMREWSLYKKMCHVVCNIEQAFQPAGSY